MAKRLEKAYNENITPLVMKNIGAKRTGYTILDGIHEISDLNLVLKSLLPSGVNVSLKLIILVQDQT